MAVTYKVAPRCNVILKDRTILRPGQIVPDGAIPKKALEEHVRNGFLLPSDKEADSGRVPGVSTNPPVSSRDGVEDQIVSGQGSDPESPRITSRPTAGADKSQWTLDPDTLKDKSLDDLNVMVLERDSSVEPFETEEEAIAYLSQDYEGK